MITDKNTKNNIHNGEKLRNYKEKKLQSKQVFDLFKDLNIEVSSTFLDNFENCCSHMAQIKDETGEHRKTVKSNNCNHRICPLCSYKKARKDALMVCTLVKHLQEKYAFIFLTLTAPNVKGEKLEEELRSYSYAFSKMFKRKEIQKAVKGYIRKLEITYNKERDDYHPHYHVLLAVNKNYFTKPEVYITQARWLELWRESKQDKSILQVDVRKFKTEEKGIKHIMELTKYISKDSDYSESSETLEHFYTALKGKRGFSFDGVFKKSRSDFERGDLNHYLEKDKIEYVSKVWHEWNGLDYVEQIERALTEEERERYNQKPITEMEID